jgi:pimeloyl-ACP methyl ester carboxylesterase
MNHRYAVAGLAALLSILSGTSTAAFATAMPATPPAIPEDYAGPGKLIDLGQGRQLNLRCDGHGSPTVLLEAGSHAESSTWYRVQPLLAARTRVCSYDRAGYGFSRMGRMPRNLDTDVADLQALIEHAGLQRPLVLVGHSLGSNIVRLYARLHPDDVRALVLIDPPAQDIAAFAPAWAKSESELDAQRLAFVRQCGDAAEHDQLRSPPPALKACLSGANPLASAKLNAATKAWKSRPAFWRTLLSELQDNASVFNQPVETTKTLGSLPLLVLTADGTYNDAPQDLRKSLEAARDQTQTRITATSSRGTRRLVKASSHDIQLDQPEVVADAVLQMLRPDKGQR